MPGSLDQRHADDESVRHLVELGYVDPEVDASQKAELRKRQKSELARAADMTAHGHVHEAAALLEKVASEDPDWVTPRLRLAEIHYSAERWDKAQAELDWLAHHGVEHPRLALIAGGVALVRRDLRTALEELQYARHADANLPSVHTLLATVLLRLGKLTEAEEAFREAARRNPSDARARDGVAVICLKRGEYEEAADWALQALEQDMRLFSGHYHLGLALARLNRSHEALQALETSTQIAPARAAPYRWLARIADEALHDVPRADRYRKRGREIIRQRRSRAGRQRLL